MEKKYIYITLIFSLLFSYLLVGGNNKYDIHLHSVAARIAYEIIFEKNIELSNIFEVNLLKPASIYHIYYILAFLIIKNTHLIVFSYYFIYFFLWGYFSYKILKAEGKLNTGYFLFFNALSLNSGTYYGMPAFMLGEVLFLAFLYRMISKRRDKKSIDKEMAIFLPLSYIFHPLIGIYMIITAGVFKEYGGQKKIRITNYVLFIMKYGIIYSLLLVFSISNESTYYFNSIGEIINFIFSTIIGVKFATWIVANGVYFFSIILPSYFILKSGSNKKRKELYLMLSYATILFMLVFPDYFGLAYMNTGRFIPFLILFYSLSTNIKMDELNIYFIAIMLVVSIMIIVFGGSYSKIIKNIGMVEKGEDNIKAGELLKDLGISKYYTVMTNTPYGKEYEEIDEGIIWSGAYIYTTHPVYMKRLKSSEEIFNKESTKSPLLGNNMSVNITCEYVMKNFDEICNSFEAVVISEKCNSTLSRIRKPSYIVGKDYIYMCR